MYNTYILLKAEDSIVSYLLHIEQPVEGLSINCSLSQRPLETLTPGSDFAGWFLSLASLPVY